MPPGPIHAFQVTPQSWIMMEFHSYLHSSNQNFEIEILEFCGPLQVHHEARHLVEVPASNKHLFSSLSGVQYLIII